MIGVKDLAVCLRETLSEIGGDSALSRLAAVLEGLWISAALADQAASVTVRIDAGIPDGLHAQRYRVGHIGFVAERARR